ncbi:UbiA family prenyltransferase [Actinoplanes sp. KI2]|uniref:UbiA family prenyltransferase n=1 Tax=Actinoplanes sp. KI2 TaxID=2983315 RepID=UPI0021D5ED79|nr:UbiA family prenyltransferase [Actinoplanes sp. KI2]MCU7728468.1 UbiA family prenyltransferase [Actinoplanes sp. KI2]
MNVRPDRLLVVAGSHLETWRPYTSCYVGLVGLAGAGLAGGRHDAGRLLAAWAIPTLGWLAGLYGGDYFDRELDAVAKPQRPIPSGRMRPATALTMMVLLVAAGAGWTLAVRWQAVAIVGVATVVGLSYNTFFKSRGVLGNLVRGTLTSCAFLFGAVLGAGRISLPLVAAAAVFCLHDAASNLVGALRDVEGDAAGGYRTLPVRRGLVHSERVVAALFLGWAALLAAVPAILGVAVPAAAALLGSVAVLTVAVVCARLLISGDGLTRRAALGAHEWLCLERIVAAGSLVALGGGGRLGLAATTAALLVTWVAQRRLRLRHEFDPGDGAPTPVLVPANEEHP